METKYVDNKSDGELAYDAYGRTVDYKNYQGLSMPAWKDLTPIIRQGWENAAREMQGNPPIPDPAWFSAFDERQQNQIRFARLYAVKFHHGADGHNNMMIIAQMADLLDKTE